MPKVYRVKPSFILPDRFSEQDLNLENRLKVDRALKICVSKLTKLVILFEEISKIAAMYFGLKVRGKDMRRPKGVKERIFAMFEVSVPNIQWLISYI